MRRLKILTYTTLFPTNVRPNFAVFVRERMRHIVSDVDLKVVSPVPYFPPVKLVKAWYGYSQVMKQRKLDGIDIFHPRYFTIPKLCMSLYGYFMYCSTIEFLQRMKQGFNFDLIDAHYAYPDGYAALLIAKKLGVPVTVTVRGTDINLFPKFPKIREKIVYTLKNVDKVISVSEDLKKKVIQLGAPEDKVVVIKNGVDTTKFYPMNSKREELNLPKNRKIILSVGNLVEKKGFQLIIKALSIIRLEESFQPLPFLVIVGDGPYRKYLESLVNNSNLRDHVMFTGRQDHSTILKWYNSCDLFCLASFREGIPNVLLESMACGKPVVATGVGGVPELLTSDDYGFIIPELVPIEVANAIVRALKKKWRAKKIVSYAQSKKWENTAQKLKAVFESII